jgi:hypothetical protein
MKNLEIKIPEVLIYQQAKSSMQSGVFKGKKWFMKFVNYETENTEYLFDLMNWIGGNDTILTINIPFNSKEEAIKFATLKGFKYSISENPSKKIKPKSYTSNFV